MDTAALIAWLVTAGSGFYVLRSWMSHGGTLRPRTGDTGAGTGTGASPPSVIFGHFGLAAAGLVIWIVYLVAGWNALAWTAVGRVAPVAGLGMATLAIGLPGPARARRVSRDVRSPPWRAAPPGLAAVGSAPAARHRMYRGVLSRRTAVNNAACRR